MNNPAPGFARHPDHRVTVSHGRERVRVLVGDIPIADSRQALRVEESRHQPVWYFPPDDVARERLVATPSTSYCPFKGHASYWSIDADGDVLEDAVWAYLTPYDECAALAGCFAFYPDRVRLEIDGEVQRPE